MIKLCFYHKIKIILLISNFFVKFYDRQPKLQSELEEREIEIFGTVFSLRLPRELSTRKHIVGGLTGIFCSKC